VYGAGAFQTLVNRDLVRCAERLFVVGGGNVGLIGAYHALQAGIDVVGLVEALPRCGGYKVHEDKIKRLGVPVWTRHTVLRAEGDEKVERVVIAEVNERFQPIPGTERAFDVDTVLIAVGLSPVDELLQKAREYGMKAYAAGDAEEIAEASAAIFSGKITGRRVARDLGMEVPIPSDWESFGDVLKHRPGEAAPFAPKDLKSSVYPLIRCVQEIPCDPCTKACPHDLISIEGSILGLPEFEGECEGCGRCVLACPGLAIQLVFNDYDPKGEKALIMMPWEFVESAIPFGQEVTTTDLEGNAVGKGRVVAVRNRPEQDRRRLLLVEVPDEDKLKVAGFRIREPQEGVKVETPKDDAGDPMICRCERVRKSEILRAIRAGIRDMNQLKAVARSGMGGCGGKTCTEQILRIFREEGVDPSEVTLPTIRPLVAEVHLGDFVKKDHKEEK
jgi:ferredoxin